MIQQYLSGTGDLKEKVKAKITETMNYEKFGCPKKYGDFYYYFYNPGLLNQHVYYQKVKTRLTVSILRVRAKFAAKILEYFPLKIFRIFKRLSCEKILILKWGAFS